MPLSVMTFIFLCFLGIVAIFFFAMRGLEKIHDDMRNEHAQLRVMLRTIESRISHPAGEGEIRPAAESWAAQSGPPESLSLGAQDSAKAEGGNKGVDSGLKLKMD